jgi:hypothetical protein
MSNEQRQDDADDALADEGDGNGGEEDHDDWSLGGD